MVQEHVQSILRLDNLVQRYSSSTAQKSFDRHSSNIKQQQKQKQNLKKNVGSRVSNSRSSSSSFAQKTHKATYDKKEEKRKREEGYFEDLAKALKKAKKSKKKRKGVWSLILVHCYFPVNDEYNSPQIIISGYYHFLPITAMRPQLDSGTKDGNGMMLL